MDEESETNNKCEDIIKVLSSSILKNKIDIKINDEAVKFERFVATYEDSERN